MQRSWKGWPSSASTPRRPVPPPTPWNCARPRSRGRSSTKSRSSSRNEARWRRNARCSEETPPSSTLFDRCGRAGGRPERSAARMSQKRGANMIKKACLVAAAMLPAVGFGQNEYPSRPVHIYVASTAGGPLDTTARFAANWWQRRLGQPFIVEARPGANQLLAIDALMRERPDGYTLLSVTSGLGSSLASMKAAPYSLTKDFAPIAMICAGGLILTTSTSVPVKTMEEFVRYLKSNPGKVNYGEPGVPVIELDEILNLLGVGASVTRVRYK